MLIIFFLQIKTMVEFLTCIECHHVPVSGLEYTFSTPSSSSEGINVKFSAFAGDEYNSYSAPSGSRKLKLYPSTSLVYQLLSSV